MFLDLAIALSCAGIGLCCGWVVHGLGWLESSDEVSNVQSSRIQLELAQARAEQERLLIVAERLRDYAVRIAIDVDDHQNSIQSINDSITADDGSVSTDAVMEAVNRLIEMNETMQSKLQSARKQMYAQAEQLESAERRAQTDALTCISNRGAFDEHLRRRHALGMERAGTLVLFDIDHFKPFNDTYGHRCGDEVLKVVAQMLHARLKSYGIVARFGGEEFAVIIDGYMAHECESIVESARVALAQQTVDFEGRELLVTASMGVAQPLEDDSVAQWIERADAALYHAKNHGRNCGYAMDAITPRLISLASPETSDTNSPGKTLPYSKRASDENAQRETVQGSENATLAKADAEDDFTAEDEKKLPDPLTDQTQTIGPQAAPRGRGTITARRS